MKKLNVGWGKKGKPFTIEQFKKSYIRKSFGGKNYSYKEYIKDINPRGLKAKRIVKAAMK